MPLETTVWKILDAAGLWEDELLLARKIYQRAVRELRSATKLHFAEDAVTDAARHYGIRFEHRVDVVVKGASSPPVRASRRLSKIT